MSHISSVRNFRTAAALPKRSTASPTQQTESTWSSTGEGKFIPAYETPSATSSNTAKTGSSFYYDPRRKCYVSETPGKPPALLFVPGNQLNFRTEEVKKAYAASYAMQSKSGLGTGVAVLSIHQPDGSYLNYLVTNRHVIMEKNQPAETMLVTSLMTGEKYKGNVLAVLPEGKPDMSLVTVKTPQPLSTVVVADSSKTAFDQRVFSIGNPIGLMGSVTEGVVSNPHRDDLLGQDVGGWLIQTDAAISPGNSGGGMFNEQGELIGLNTLSMTATPDTPTQNLNFAFPVDVGLSLLLQQVAEKNKNQPVS